MMFFFRSIVRPIVVAVWLLTAVMVNHGLAKPFTSTKGDLVQPNILLILADDLGYGDVACYNHQSKVPTPNLDRFAATGMRFTDAHSPCTVCTPTRYSLLTGQMAFRVPRGGRVFSGAGGPSLITPDRWTLPKFLQSQGYATACFGKWHLGLTFYDDQGLPIHDGSPDAIDRIDYSRRIDGGPLDCGFDEFFGTACCPTTDWLYAYIDGDRIPHPPTQKLDKRLLPKHPFAGDNRPGMQAPDFDLQQVDLEFLERSRRFLKRHVETSPDRPFFLFHSTQAVHLPSFAAPRFHGSTEAGPHGDFIFELDHIVGELLRTLDELGISEETVVIFTSDNGPEVPTVYHMRTDHDHDPAHPWRGMKRDNWEGGHRVPLIVRWPGVTTAGSIADSTVSLCDVAATVADALHRSLPHDAAEDGFSWMATLRGNKKKEPQRYVLHQGFAGRRSLAIREGKWKYLDHPGSGGNNYQTHRLLQPYRLPKSTSSGTAQPAPQAQLYDLEADPGETVNLIDQHPDVARHMETRLRASIDRGRSRD